MQTDERRSLALTLGLITVCIAAYFLLFVPPALKDLGRASLSTSYDFQSYFLPKFIYGSEELRHGRFPLWNPYEYGGVPFFATAQPEVLYPPKALLFLLFSPSRAYWAFMVVHFVGLAAGFLFFAREQKLTGLPAFVGAAAWTFALPVLMSNYHPTRIANLVPVPFVFLIVERIGKHGANPRRFAALALVVALQLLAGYPETSMDLGLLVALHAIVQFLTNEWEAPPWRTVPVLAAAFVMAGAMTAIQLLPMLEAGVAANRVGVAEEVIAVPMAVPEPFMTPKIGIVPLFVGFAVLGMFTRRSRAASVGLVACVAITAGGWLLLRMLPGFGMVRFPYVWFILAPFYAAWLAALGTQAVLAPKQSPRAAGVRAALVIAVGVVWAGFCVVEWKRLSAGTEPTARFFDRIAHNIGTKRGAALGILAGLGLAAVSVPVVARKTGRAGLAGPLVLSVFSHLAGYPFGTRPASVARPNSTGEVRRFLDAGWPLKGRALSIDDIVYGYELTDRIPSVLGAEESFVPFRYRRILAEWHCVPMFGWFDWGAFTASRGFLDALNLRYVAAPVFAVHMLSDAGLRPILRRSDTLLFENAHPMGPAWVNYSVRKAASADEALALVLDADFDPRREVVVEDKLAWSYRRAGDELVTPPEREERVSPNEVEFTVKLPQNGVFVVSETFYPGWTATVDKYPATIIPVDYVLRGVELPPGRHHVRLSYRPKSVRYGLAITLVAFAAWLGLAVQGFRRRRSRTAT